MNGAERLARTLAEAGIEVCFANPGTSEMHFVAALDREPRIRAILGVFEGVVSAAADGYARMAGKPAATLLHLAPGMANAGANLHNARKARTPMVNIIGDHASQHARFDAPLTADVPATAACFSDWVRVSQSADQIGQDAIAACAAAASFPGRVASLILPADTAWSPSEGAAPVPLHPSGPRSLSEAAVAAAADVLRQDEPTVLILGGRVLANPEALDLAGRIALATGCALRAPTFNSRVERGAGHVAVPRIPYPVDAAVDDLGPYRRAILVETDDPVGFFAYPGKPSRMLPAHCAVLSLADRDQCGATALAALADQLSVGPESAAADFKIPGPPSGTLDGMKLAAVVARSITDGMIVVDEAITLGEHLGAMSHGAAPHSWLALTGGAIGCGPPLAAGAAIGAPDRPVLALLADGSALYTLQGLWTQAREQTRVVNVILSNRRYAILEREMAGVGANPGPAALELFRLQDPVIDWVDLARGFGVSGERVATAEDLETAIQRGMATDGPYVVEALFG